MSSDTELQERKSPDLPLSVCPSPTSTLLKKCEARTPDTQRLTNLPSRPPVKMAFEDITYSVQVGGSCCRRQRELQERKSPDLPLSVCPSPTSTLLKKCEARTPDTQRLTNLPSRPPVKLAFEDITYSVQVGGSCCRRQRGFKWVPSRMQNSVKTTMTKGTVLVNGEIRDPQLFRRMSCYIMQDSHLLPHLTVREQMHVAAGLKLPRRMKWSEKKAAIDEIMSLLGLMECAKTRTSQISGGQTKRLAIAQELINNPPVMFFDEPTSGLDSMSSLTCVKLLKSLAHGGRTVICTIHQPSAKLFEMFDKLYILGDGQCLYRGTVANLVPYLHSMGFVCPPYHNPADFGGVGYKDERVEVEDEGRHWLKVAVFVGPVSSIPILLFSGFFVTLDNIPSYLRWMSYGSFVRYSYEGVMISVYGHDRGPIPCKSQDHCIFETAQDILDELDIGSDNLTLDFGVLAVFFIILRVICYCILRMKVKRLI
eukprot:XP_011674849.1 PREDICTED: ATP-binding cassette sub-family G member 4 [Strongylocentrotus purpuratus]